MGWRVGNGESIYIFHSNWIPERSSFKPFTSLKTPNPSKYPPNSVADLIRNKGDIWDWNTSLIRQLFSEIDAERILPVLVSPSNLPDTIAWLPHKDGTFNVKKGYWFAKHVQMLVEDRPKSCIAGQNLLLNYIWILSLHPRISI